MEYKILEANGTEIENVDGGAFNNFCAGGQSGIVAEVLNECSITSAGSIVTVNTGLLNIKGIRVKITAPKDFTLQGTPAVDTIYRIVAKVVLLSGGNVSFDLYSTTSQTLIQNNLYKNSTGTYEIELATFTHLKDGGIKDLKRTAKVLYANDIKNIEQIIVNTLEELKTALTNGLSPIAINNTAILEVSSTITIPANTTLMGNGATIKRATGFEGVLIQMLANSIVKDLIIDGNRTAMVSPTWDKTIDIATREKCIVENITINNGNEAIVVYEDDVLVKGCKITNCGGNGIHFSGANRVRVEDCVVIGANKRSGMGHENGCIIWSNSCNYIVCENNYCEDGIAGFGSIDSFNNSNLKILGNTVKDCTYAVEGRNLTSGINNKQHDIIISNNHFINSVQILLQCTNPDDADTQNIVISNNIFDNTYISIKSFYGVAISGNTINTLSNFAIFLGGCPFANIIGNNLKSDNYTIYLEKSANYCSIVGNTIITNGSAIYMASAERATVSNNVIRQTLQAIIKGRTNNIIIVSNTTWGCIFNGNILSVYTTSDAISALGKSDIATDNIFDHANNTGVSIRVWGGGNSFIVKNNISNATFQVSTGTNSVVENNLTGSPRTDFYDVTFALTGITTDGYAKILKEDDYECTLTAESGKTLPTSITVVEGETTLTANKHYTYDNTTGKLTVYGVDGALTITAIA